MPNVMAALPNIGGTLCSMPQSMADANYYLLLSLEIFPQLQYAVGIA